MKRMIIEVDNAKNATFLIGLLKKFDFVKSIKTETSPKTKLPIQWAKKDANTSALAGIWKDTPITIEEIREKAWKRL